MNTVWTIVLAVLVFSVFIIVHELGHFLTAKAFHMKVNEFSMGFGPRLLHVQKGETTYALRAFPFGGFVALEGEDDESGDDRAFQRFPVWKRAVMMAAGGVMNLLLGFVVVLVVLNLQSSIGTTRVSGFQEQAVSEGALLPGDEIVRVNGGRVRIDNDIVFALVRDTDGLVEMQVRRDGQLTDLQVPFRMTQTEDGQNSIYIDFTVYPAEKSIGTVLYNGVFYTVSIAKMVWVSLLDLVTGKVGVNQLAGPIGVTAVISQASSLGLRPFLMLVAFITVNLGVFNLLPIPALDGGKLLFLLIEAVCRKPVPAKYENYVHTAGFMLLMLLIVFVTFHDIMRLFNR